MSHSESGDASPSQPESGDDLPTRPRTTVQAALQITLEDSIKNAREFAVESGVPSSTISEFKNHRRGINLTTLQMMLDALSTRQYIYFLEVLTRGDVLLDKKSIDLIEESDLRSVDTATLKRAFHALVSSYCSKCSREEQLELLAVIHQASINNTRLLDG